MSSMIGDQQFANEGFEQVYAIAPVRKLDCCMHATDCVKRETSDHHDKS
jgi:hypothetical protein